MPYRKTTLFLSVIALTALGAATSMVPVQDVVKTISLYGSTVEVRPGGQVETILQSSSSYNSTSNTVTMEVQTWVPSGVAAQAGDFNGGNNTDLTAGAVNKVTLTYDVAAGTMKMTVTRGGSTTSPVTLPFTGIFDQFDTGLEVTEEQLPDISETKKRMRIVLRTYGLTTGFTLRDA